MTDAEPFVVCTYGNSGIGKTVDNGYSFPGALFVAAPGALTSIQKVCGYTPAFARAETIEDATGLINEAQKKGYKTVVIDDFSFLAEKTASVLEDKYKTNKLGLWGALRQSALDFRESARYAQINVVLNCWEQGPRTIKETGAKIRGGPQLSGKLPEQIPAMCDIVLRAVYDPNRRPHKASYECGINPNYVMKDRFNIVDRISPAPLNLAEILRYAGRDIPYHAGIKGASDYVNSVTEVLMKLDDTVDPADELNKIYSKLKGSGLSVPAVRWILRDSFDRSQIRKALMAAENEFISTAGATL